MLRAREYWERLVGAVIKKQHLWELFHKRSPSEDSEASSSDQSSSSFWEIDIPSAYSYRVQNLVLLSDFVPALSVEDINLNSFELLGTGTLGNTYAVDVSYDAKIVVKIINKSISVSEEEFQRSMDLVGRINHENVVALRAYYCCKDEKLMMYDYYSQGSVYHLLHDQTSDQVEWKTRLRIAIGAARGLASIHAQNGGVPVHGNIKSTNIFLNKKNYGSISDFGMINLIAANFRQNERCLSPKVKNTRNVSQESDVYSFGILLFELLTRKPSVQVVGGPDAVDLVKLIKSVKSTNKTSKVFDPYLLEDPTIRKQVVRVLQIGISCVVKDTKKRPKMSEVAKILEDLHIYGTRTPKRPALVLVNQTVKPKVAKMLEYIYIAPKGCEDTFDLEDLLCACPYILKKGTFQNFYTVFLKNGLTVWVQTVENMNMTSEEFEQYMEINGRIKHKSCAKLKAYYFSKDLVLMVFDHINQENLHELLYGTYSRTRKPLGWDARLRIALTLAKAIVHIHTLDGSTLGHGNIESYNIFVDKDNNAIITNPAMRKEPTRYYVSQSSDIYCFGVVLIELLTRISPPERINGDERASSLVSYIQNYVVRDLTSIVQNHWLVWFMDIELLGNDAAIEMAQLAKDCVEDSQERRPTMSVVVKRLEHISRIYQAESEPSTQSDSSM